MVADAPAAASGFPPGAVDLMNEEGCESVLKHVGTEVKAEGAEAACAVRPPLPLPPPTVKLEQEEEVAATAEEEAAAAPGLAAAEEVKTRLRVAAAATDQVQTEKRRTAHAPVAAPATGTPPPPPVVSLVVARAHASPSPHSQQQQQPQQQHPHSQRQRRPPQQQQQQRQHGGQGSSQFKGVQWSKSRNNWDARSKGQYLGSHATEEEAAKAVDDYTKHGTVPESKERGGWGSSQFKGVTWQKSSNKWKAESAGQYLGFHATEEEAARAVDDYVMHGIVPESKASGGWGSSQFKGVSWHKSKNKWQAQCGKKSLGRHAAEKDAARAYNVEAARLGLALNVIPPAGAAGAGTGEGTGLGAGTDHTLNVIPPAGAAGAGAGPNAGRKRAAPKTPADAQKNKKMKLDVALG
jgi:hypothetical protein